MFESTKEQLQKLLERVHKGEIQLPEFQRGWVWSEDNVRSLLTSVINGFPVGALLTLQTGSDAVSFVPRPIEGSELSKNVEPDELLLDGQQRMTTLYQSLWSREPVQALDGRNKRRQRYFFLDIARAVEQETVTEAAIVSVPADMIERKNFDRDIKIDLSTTEKQYEQHHFPLNKTFDSTLWYHGWIQHWLEKDPDHYRNLAGDFDRFFLQRIRSYEVPFKDLASTVRVRQFASYSKRSTPAARSWTHSSC